MTTPYQAKYWANALTIRNRADELNALSRSIAGSRVDLNPHQVDAALFAIRSPLSRGVILADEVGLGKTIEAGLVLAQRWAERRRKILIVLPATLRTQWQQELWDKFQLPGVVLESRGYDAARAAGNLCPFDQRDRIVFCSYHFAAAKAADLARVPWDLVVLDEAHRLRNVHKPGNKIARAIHDAIADRPKLLLTATPLQNTLLELYGLVSFIDSHVFGDEVSFRDQFVRGASETARNDTLRQRLASICKRTLRRQVLEYVRFTQRLPLTQDFLPTDEEHALYEEVSAYLRRSDLLALPAAQRQLMTMVLRKLLASSSFAIAATLRSLLRRLEGMADDAEAGLADFESIDELRDEWEDEAAPPPAPTSGDMLRDETEALRRYVRMAEGIQHNAKGTALLTALETALDRAVGLGAQRRAVVFTESRRTQEYLFGLLEGAGYRGQVALLNGSNTDPRSREIHEGWSARRRGQGVVSGTRAVDVKAAIVEEFRDRVTVLVATEAAAEGVNLQFCSLVVNYDLPWNPQRIEQRIGRCHRYGQKHDVVVVNFVNRRNAADQRVFELLSEKFHLFEGVFGASDEVLGAVESGVDLERRIAEAYQTCRTEDEIRAGFDALRSDLEAEIQDRMSQTRRAVLETFDEDVHMRLRLHQDAAMSTLSRHGQRLLALTRSELAGQAEFEEDAPRFRYHGTMAPHGWYHLDWREAERRGDAFYRQDHPLAERLIAAARDRPLPVAEVVFDASAANVAALVPFVGRAGWLRVSRLAVETFDVEEFLVLAAVGDDGAGPDAEACDRMLNLPATVAPGSPATATDASLREAEEAIRTELLRGVEQRNSRLVDDEVQKLDSWADDLKVGLERELRELDVEVRGARRASAAGVTLADKLQGQRRVKSLEQRRSQMRRRLFEAQDDIDAQRGSLIDGIERQLAVTSTSHALFHVRWRLTARGTPTSPTPMPE